MITLPKGEAPSEKLSVKLWRTVSLPEGSSLNTVPHPTPPAQVVPYRLPCASMIRRACGLAPPPPLKLNSRVTVGACAATPPRTIELSTNARHRIETLREELRLGKEVVRAMRNLLVLRAMAASESCGSCARVTTQ